MRTVWICALIAAVSFPAVSFAGLAGRQKTVSATSMYTTIVTVPINTLALFETVNLSAGADSVIHIQDYNTGAYVTGNDDCSGSLRSCVTFYSSTSARTLRLVLRAYSASTAGTATLRIDVGGSVTESAQTLGGNVISLSAPIAATSHVFTVQEQGGNGDTVLLVLSGTPDKAIKFDDDSGVDAMSWLHTDENCVSPCRVAVGGYNGRTGTTTVIWDEDIHKTQCDNDGMSDALEAALATTACDDDTDDDAIPDGAEVIGVDTRTKYPYMGADPLKPDIFIEADWIDCAATDGSCGTPPNRDKWRLSAQTALDLVNFYAPDFTVHIDTGVTNLDPATWFKYGNWGGASRLTTKGPDKCADLDTQRVGKFHHARIDGQGTGGQADWNACFDSSIDPTILAQESGHNFLLEHGGNTGTGQMNCKPHYRSPMNYAYQYDSSITTFSRNGFSSSALNPTSLNEATGLGTADWSKISFLTNGTWAFNVRSSDGAVDWNRDGQYAAAGTTTRGAPTWAWGPGGCEQSVARMDWLPAAKHPTYAWVQTTNNIPRAYVFSRNPTTGYVEYRWSESVNACSNFVTDPTWDATCTGWTPAKTAAATALNSTAGSYAPAAAPLVDEFDDMMFVVFTDSANVLYFQALWVIDGVEYKGAVTRIGVSNIVATGDPALVAFNGGLRLYVPVGTELRRYDFDRELWKWVFVSAQQWSDGSLIQPTAGIGVASGFVGTPSTEVLVAAIPSAGRGLDIAWLDESTGRWTRRPDSDWSWGRPTSITFRPGIAYVPFSASTPSAGRWYVSWQASGSPMNIAMTEGHDMSLGVGSRRFRWLRTVWVFNQWAQASGGISLGFDRRFDQNLRATWTGTDGTHLFAPLADGVANTSLKDQDDYTIIRQNLTRVSGT